MISTVSVRYPHSRQQQLDTSSFAMSTIRWQIPTKGCHIFPGVFRSNSRNRINTRNLQIGVTYVEYLVSSLGMIFVLFAPLPGGAGASVIDLLIQAIQGFGQNTTLLLSLP